LAKSTPPLTPELVALIEDQHADCAGVIRKKVGYFSWRCGSRVGPHDEEDLSQDAWLEIVEGAHRYDGDVGAGLAGYMKRGIEKRVGKNVCRVGKAYNAPDKKLKVLEAADSVYIDEWDRCGGYVNSPLDQLADADWERSFVLCIREVVDGVPVAVARGIESLFRRETAKRLASRLKIEERAARAMRTEALECIQTDDTLRVLWEESANRGERVVELVLEMFREFDWVALERRERGGEVPAWLLGPRPVTGDVEVCWSDALLEYVPLVRREGASKAAALTNPRVVAKASKRGGKPQADARQCTFDFSSPRLSVTPIEPVVSPEQGDAIFRGMTGALRGLATLACAAVAHSRAGPAPPGDAGGAHATG
jgi:DNA-directed RNA polymerase specialized sigma24 family protein